MIELEFIKNKLIDFQSNFNEFSFICEFDSSSKMFIVEVIPSEMYEQNQEYLNFEADLTFEFDNNFYPFSLLFISENSTVKIKNPSFELICNEAQFISDVAILLSDLLGGELNTKEIYKLLSDNDIANVGLQENKTIKFTNTTLLSECSYDYVLAA